MHQAYAFELWPKWKDDAQRKRVDTYNVVVTRVDRKGPITDIWCYTVNSMKDVHVICI